MISAVGFLGLLCLFVAFRMIYSRSEATLPKAHVQSTNVGWVDETRCAECHEQAETFWETGHARTLMPAEDSQSRLLLEELNEFLQGRPENSQVYLEDDRIVAVHQDKDRSRLSTVRLDWCFGSGEHARTWVGTLTDSHGATDLLEYRWSWFHEIDDFATTPGQPQNVGGGYFAGLGLLFDAPKAKMCFSCHGSYLPEESGRINVHEMKPGVTCQRCHGPRQAHVESEGDIVDDSWRTADQMESVNRCAECHRRAEDQKPGDVNIHNREIVRFQPVGLVQSPCFKGSQMTCLTCHDPHKTLADQDSMGIWQCVQCHDGTVEHPQICSAGHTDRCVQCHMPKIPMKAPLKFTDHWIRIRKPSESAQ